MSVPNGFKQTEVGVIPQDWGVVSVDSISYVTSGKRLPKGSNLLDSETLYPYIRVADMYMGGVDISEIKYVPESVFPIIEKYRIYLDDIFISVAGTLGIIGKIPRVLDGANLTENANRITKITCDRDYLMYVLMSSIIQNTIETERTLGAQPKLALTRIRNFQIPLPPTRAEQTAIAAALSDMDALIEGVEKLLEKKRRIKQGAMQELLRPKEGWEKTKLGAISNLYQPETISEAKFTDEGYLVYGANGIIGKYSRYNHEHWQTIITCRGSTCGTVNKTLDKVWITGNAMVVNIQNNKRIDKLFLFHLLKHQDFRSCITGSGQPQIVRSPLFDYILHLPKTLQEQIAIAAILSDMDSEIEELETQLTKYRQLKTGMMQELLTGKKRLV